MVLFISVVRFKKVHFVLTSCEFGSYQIYISVALKSSSRHANDTTVTPRFRRISSADKY